MIVDVNERLKRETSLLAEKQGLDDLIKHKTIELRESLINLENENKRRIIAQASLIKAKNEAEKANIKKSEFLSRISHELRTPLNAILGFSQLLEYEEMAEDQKSMISEISTAGHHLIGLINEILELSRIESGNAHVVIEDIAIKDVIRDCAAIIKMQPRAETIRFEDKTEQHENYMLRADKTKIKEVLLNLLTNAVKYNRKDGKVTIDYKITENNMLRFSVADTGVGIKASKLKGLFEPFNRLGAEHTDIEGTGIGLTISKELMELMHGNIGVNSEEGVGTEFWIECQLSSSDSQTLKQTEKKPTRFVTEKLTILSIEDNLANQRLIEQVIKRNTQFKIEGVFNAEEGIEKAIQLQPSLVLMDIHLPDMDGYAAIKQFQQHSQLKNIPVIAISATATEGSLEKGRRAGFKDYITKPINTDELICKIMDVLEVSERKVG